MVKSYSQCGQDLFVYSLMKGTTGKFLDLGCYLPKKINNTYLLELNGWDGISIDIKDYSEEWKERKSKFIQADCMNSDFDNLLKNHYKENVIDYLTLDMEKRGERFKLLEKVLNTNYEFKIITIEHDSYLGEDFVKSEKVPQRNLLTSKGYKLVGSDISHSVSPTLFFEDWWINPKYFSEDEIKPWISEKVSCDKIFNKLGIEYNLQVID
jgi:hypothetical protein